MPRHESSRLKLSYGWLRGEDWWGDPVSDNFLKIDMLLNPYVLSMTEIVPPVNGLAVGDMYIVPEGAVLAWSGHTNDLAVYDGAKWVFCSPTRGVRARLANPSAWIWFNGTGWVDESQGEGAPPAPQGTRYDVALSIGYEAEPQETLLVFALPEAMTWPTGAPGSTARSLVAPLGILRLTVKRNGADVGTITFSPGSVKGVFSVVGNKPFAAGDVLSIHMPDDPPAGFQNYSATLRLILQK
jgi:hypothetical protein